MIFELTRDYAIVVPLMIANMVSLAISRNFQRVPIYEALALQDGIHLPRHSRERDESGPFVADIMYTEPAILPASTLVADAVSRGPAIAVAAGRHSVAAFSRSELEDAAEYGMQSEPLDTLVEMREENPHLHADHLIEEALEKLQEAGVEAAPVVDRSDISVVRGVVTLASVRQSFGVGKS
jgi:CIC family chloride channel protein